MTPLRRRMIEDMRARLPAPHLQRHNPVDNVVQIWSRSYAFWSTKFAPAYRALQFQISCPSRWKVLIATQAGDMRFDGCVLITHSRKIAHHQAPWQRPQT